MEQTDKQLKALRRQWFKTQTMRVFASKMKTISITEY